MLQRGIMATETASVSSTVSVTNSQAGYSVELRKNFNALAVFAAHYLLMHGDMHK